MILGDPKTNPEMARVIDSDQAAATSSDEVRTLSYAAFPSWRSSALRSSKVLVAIALVAVLALCAYELNWVRRAQTAYWAWRCAVYSMRISSKVLETDPQKAQRLISGDPDYIPASANPALTSSSTAVHAPESWRRLASLDYRVASFAEDQGPRPLCFLGELRSPNGTRWLVAAGAGFFNGNALAEGIPAIVLRRSSFWEDSPSQMWSKWGPQNGRFDATELLLGYRDAQDTSHLTVPYKRYSGFSSELIESGILDAYVQDDGSLRWKVSVTTLPSK